MGWKSDAQAQEAVKHFLMNQKDDLDQLITQLFKFNDGSPPFQFLQLYGKFVFIYSEYASIYTESEAWDLAVAEIMNDPVIQQLSAQMVGDKIDQRLKHE
jgi:hypothetical protein